VAVPVALMAAGTVMQMLSQYGANLQQAEAEKANAEYFRMQADFAQDAQLRSERLAAFEYSQRIGEQIGAYAASGVDMSGSATLTVAGTLANYTEELLAIRKKGMMEMRLANARGKMSEDTAKLLASPTYNLTQAATTGLSAYAASEGFGSWNNNRGVEYKYASGGPGSGTKSTGYGAGKPGTFIRESFSASDMGTFRSFYLGNVGGE